MALILADMHRAPTLRHTLGLAVAAVALCAATATSADAATTATTSSNWAGYAVMRNGVRFNRVSAAWTAPAVDCSSARQQWSAVWVGLGGYSTASTALEQIGTEADCSASGRASYSTWYELVPDVSHSAELKLHPGDKLSASVTVSGHTVRLRMADDTTGKVFAKTLHASAVDLSSAEWIVEAPSACADTSGLSCQIMPLADFGTTSIAQARARNARGHTGTIADSAWDAAQITLSEGNQRFDGPGGQGGPGGPGGRFGGSSGSAAASTLDTTGGAFSVSWAAQ